MLKKALIAEFVGTFALVFAGTGAIVIDSLTGKIGNPGIAMSFGLAVGVMVYSVGHISGAHFNPAVTIGFYCSKNMKEEAFAPYILAQIAGATFASSLLYLMFGVTAGLGVTLPQGKWMTSFILEVIMTFFLMFVILTVALDERVKPEVRGLAIGGTVALNAFFGGPISGASMNPARSIAPALITGIYQYQWIYLTAPIAGSLIAVASYNYLKRCGPAN